MPENTHHPLTDVLTKYFHLVCKDPDNPVLRRKLLSAAKLFNESWSDAQARAYIVTKFGFDPTDLEE